MATKYELERAREFVPFDPFADLDGFPLCCISKQTVIYSCGIIFRELDVIAHNHHPDELKLCSRLADKAAKVVRGLEVGMGSEGTPAVFEGPRKIVWGTETFSPFFITAQAGDRVPSRFSESLVRKKFGGVIFPECVVRVEALRETGRWWRSVLHWYSDSTEEESAPNLAHWRRMMDWFADQKDFTDCAFVTIGDGPEHGGAHFPRLALGLTKAGSVAGIIGLVVHT